MKNNSRKTGDDAEKFVAEIVRKVTKFLVEIHPRTFRVLHIGGKVIQVSQDNDYHNLFDEKAEGPEYMIYIQVKVEEEKSNVSKAQKDIDTYYPYEFPYQRIQTWQVWKEWVKPEKGRRRKEYRYRIQERKGFSDTFWKGTEIRKGNWVDVELSSLGSQKIDVVE